MNILCVTAHPDDESVFAGGTLALLAAAGAEVGILCCTRGEGGEAGEPPLASRAELGSMREAELRCAARALGCASVGFLPFRDPDIGPQDELFAFAPTPEAVAPLLAERFRPLRPDALITHGSGGEYGHPAHILVHRAVLQAARGEGIPAVFSFHADYEGHPRRRAANRDDPADFIVNVDSVFDRKLAAMECHRTQGALFVRRASAEAGRPVPLRDVILRRESFHRAFSAAAGGAGGRDIFALVESFLVPG
ncbi:MAG: PIG-L family deacetylase [Anaerolineales bacterium]|nr:PIG-L family deacetylase [Anaerolineales bacterium]